MRRRFTKGRHSVEQRTPEKRARRVTLGLDIGMTWTKLVVYDPDGRPQLRPARLKDWEVAVRDPVYEEEALRGVTDTLHRLTRARKFKPYIGTREHVPKTEKTAAKILEGFVGDLISQWAMVVRDVRVERVVVTAPVTFSVVARRELVEKVNEALARQGLGEGRVELILPEPVAAAFSEEAIRQVPPGRARTYVVYDLGGSTFDCAIVRAESKPDGGGVWTVLATGGVRECGGEFFDEKIAEAMGIRGRDARNLRVLEREKIELSVKLSRLRDTGVSEEQMRRAESERRLEPNIGERRTLSAAEIRELLTPQIERTLEELEATVRRAGLEWRQIDAVLLTGGSSLLWFVPDLVRKAVPEQVPVRRARDPIRAVALGAAAAAGMNVRLDMPLAEDILLELPLESQDADVDIELLDDDVVLKAPIDERSTSEHVGEYIKLFGRGERARAARREISVRWMGSGRATVRLVSRQASNRGAGESERPAAVFTVDVPGARIGEAGTFEFTIDEDGKSVPGAIPGLMLPALKVRDSRGRALEVTASVDVEQVEEVVSEGWTLSEVKPRIDISLLIDATGSSRHREAPREVVESLWEAIERFRRRHEGVDCAVRVLFYGDTAHGEAVKPVPSCPADLLPQVMDECPTYLGVDACESVLEALERALDQLSESPPGRWTRRLALVLCDADDKRIDQADMGELVETSERLREKAERGGCFVVAIGTPGERLTDLMARLPSVEDTDLKRAGIQKAIPLGDDRWRVLAFEALLEASLKSLRRDLVR